jgi:hypothetical protein
MGLLVVDYGGEQLYLDWENRLEVDGELVSIKAVVAYLQDLKTEENLPKGQTVIVEDRTKRVNDEG